MTDIPPAADSYPTMAHGGFDDAEIGAMIVEIDSLRHEVARLQDELIAATAHWRWLFDDEPYPKATDE